MSTAIESFAPPRTKVALASYVDRNYIEGFEVLVRSLVLSNPWLDLDYVVLYSDLEAPDFARLAPLYPHFTFRKVDTGRFTTYRKGDGSNYLVEKAYYILDVFKPIGYERVVTLDVDMVVVGDIRHLVETDAEFTAAPQYFDSDGGRKLNSGVMSVGDAYLTAGFASLLDAIGRSGDYELERHDQGVLTAALNGAYQPLDVKYNLVKRAVRFGGDAPEDTRIIHYTGKYKPWNGGERGYEQLERAWHAFGGATVKYWRRCSAGTPVHSELARLAAPFDDLSDQDLDNLQRASIEYERAGDNERALLALEALALDNRILSADQWFRWGQLLRGASQPEAARAALLMAAGFPDFEVRAHVALSELAWVYRDDDLAHEHAVLALQVNPVMRKPRLMLGRLKAGFSSLDVPPGTGKRIGHVAFYVDSEGNFGDVMLPLAVRTSIATTVPDPRWTSIHAHQIFDVSEAQWANENLDAIVIGGGGLFLPDTSANGNSGWQWNVTDAALRLLEIPVIVYTVGFNLFRGQVLHGRRFEDSVAQLVGGAAFVGLRNNGSVRRVTEILGEERASILEYLPCVTTVFGALTNRPPSLAQGTPVVYLNVAFDRQQLRFGDGYQDFLEALAGIVEDLKGVAEVRSLAHTKTDERFVRDLRRVHGITIESAPLYAMKVDEALATIEGAAAVVGMRGHAGMIPLGLGVPIVSLISHDKLRYFLEDIGRPEWGVDAHDPLLRAKVTALVTDIVVNQEVYRSEVATVQRELLMVVQDANQRIADVVGGARN
ncbi:glycosyltransferase [Demequina oxidasica]|uniref:glycosyltransferase n=1 Tax=Demequina oxidasica TaxID=676199 RepID=UPI0007835C0F|nr:glycosyltransferase [Demequina oxidasica]